MPKERDDEIFGKFELGTCNDHGEKWIQWCTTNDQQHLVSRTPRTYMSLPNSHCLSRYHIFIFYNDLTILFACLRM